MKPYVLITPARNEEAFIEKTIQAVIAQTVLPKKWVIVSDGSVDRTDEIVNQYAEKHDFILLVRRSGDQKRNFGSKAKAFEFGYERLKDLEFDFIGNLDADVSFNSTYYESILSRFQDNKRLGVAGGIRYDLRNGRFHKILRSRNSVGGALQLFRRQCYESIGGYLPLEYGGIDAVAETMARMHGWEVESFPELEVYHYRRTGTASERILRARFRSGIRAYLIGYHALFEISRCISRLFRHPPVIGSLVTLSGFFWASLKRYDRPVSDDFVRYLRSEQLARLRSVSLQTGLFHPGSNRRQG
jgi:biofilm PGA synthesis N-glycosyltransferase PgaC